LGSKGQGGGRALCPLQDDVPRVRKTECKLTVPTRRGKGGRRGAGRKRERMEEERGNAWIGGQSMHDTPLGFKGGEETGRTNKKHGI